MRIYLTSVLVDDQEKALRFYTDVLGFVKKNDIPLGEARWLTVVSPDHPEGTELALEPDSHPAAGPFKAALVADGIPVTSFACRVPAAPQPRRPVHPGAGRDGRRDHGGARRHLRQPDPDRQGVTRTSVLPQPGHDPLPDHDRRLASVLPMEQPTR